MNAPLVIRPVQIADAANLQANCFSRNTLAQIQASIEENLCAFVEAQAVQIVAVVEGVVVGSSLLKRTPHALMRHRGELYSLVVGEAYQGRGLARRMLQSIVEQAKSWGLTILEVSCRAGTPAEQVYLRLGFQEYGRLPQGLVEPWGEQLTYDQVFFWLSIPSSCLPDVQDYIV